MAKWTKVGSLRKSQKGGLYIKVDTDANLKKGDALQLKDPRKGLDEAVANGRMSQEKADELKAKIPDYIRYEVTLVTEN